MMEVESESGGDNSTCTDEHADGKEGTWGMSCHADWYEFRTILRNGTASEVGGDIFAT